LRSPIFPWLGRRSSSL